ncbi:MAG: protein kinase [Sandaracinaceae bacterium]
MTEARACASCGQENRGGARYCLRCGAQLDLVSPEDPLLGRLLQDRYRILRLIGAGGMGRVYLAEQRLGNATRPVAVKVLQAGQSDAQRRRFLRETEVVVGLEHPHTIQFYDVGTLDDGRLFIVMEYVDGRSLRDELARGRMPYERVARLLPQIAGSLSEAHERGVVHRDLKPDNILLTTRGGEADYVKVLDFGVAKRWSPAEVGADGPVTLEGHLVGTPPYMSPEQLAGGPIDARADVYALGLLLYEMLSGTRPFRATTPLEWAAKHTTARPPPLASWPDVSDVPEAAARAVMAALAKNPADRPASVRELAARFLGRDEGVVTPASLLPPTRDWPSDPDRSELVPTVEGPLDEGADVARPGPVRRPVVLVAVALAIGVAALALGILRLGSGEGTGSPPQEWIRIVHQQKRVEDAARALGAPDGEHAIVPPGGTITLELAAGTLIASDGGPGPDVYIEIDDERSGHYRADVGVARHQYTTLGEEFVGSLGLDADQFGITRIRYVRIKNRGERTVYLDAVGAYRTTGGASATRGSTGGAGR